MSSEKASGSQGAAAAAAAPAAGSSGGAAAQPAGADLAAKQSAKEAKAAAKEAKAARRAQAKGTAVGGTALAAADGASAASSAPRFRPDGTPILSKAERKARDAASARPNAPAQAAGANSSSAAPAGASGSAPRQARQQQQQQQAGGQPPAQGKARAPAAAHQPYSLTSITSSLFGNVHTPPSQSALSVPLVQSLQRRAVHPSVLLLGTLLSTYQLTGANARAMAVLLALRDFIADYRTPDGATLTRDLVAKLGNQIAFLKEARPLGTSVGHAIRYLKYEISVTDKDWDEATAKAHLMSRIDHFIRDRITYAGRVIQSHIHSKIRPGMTVLTYGRSSVVEAALLSLRRSGVTFNAIVIDSGRPLNEGQAMLATLSGAGMGKGGEEGSLTFGPLSALSTLMPRADLVLLGTASLMSNGALYARAGTSLVAMTASELGKPVIVACETYKFSDRIQLDAFAGNEAGGAADLLVDDSAGMASGEMDDELPLPLSKEAAAGLAATAGPLTTSQATQLRSNLHAVNLLYDITPPRFVTAVASEVGLSGPESVGVILRDYKSVLFGV